MAGTLEQAVVDTEVRPFTINLPQANLGDGAGVVDEVRAGFESLR